MKSLVFATLGLLGSTIVAASAPEEYLPHDRALCGPKMDEIGCAVEHNGWMGGAPNDVRRAELREILAKKGKTPEQIDRQLDSILLLESEAEQLSECNGVPLDDMTVFRVRAVKDRYRLVAITDEYFPDSCQGPDAGISPKAMWRKFQEGVYDRGLSSGIAQHLFERIESSYENEPPKDYNDVRRRAGTLASEWLENNGEGGLADSQILAESLDTVSRYYYKKLTSEKEE